MKFEEKAVDGIEGKAQWAAQARILAAEKGTGRDFTAPRDHGRGRRTGDFGARCFRRGAGVALAGERGRDF